jgi:nucleoside-diphosphate-sugar epimerase
MKALVTGAAGFIGGLLVEDLVRSGHVVTALTRDPARTRDLESLGVRIVLGDLSTGAGLREALGDQEVVFHVAGLIKARDESEFARANVDGVRRIVQAAEAARTPRLVHVSSMAAAGPAERGRPLREGDPERPLTPYGRSKLAGERIVRESGLAWTIVRPPMVYGPRDREVLRVFRMGRRGFVPVLGDGQQELCAVFGTDLAEALTAVARSDRTLHRTYYACHAERFTSEELAREVGRAMGREIRVLRVPPAAGRLLLGVTGRLAQLAGRATLLHGNKSDELMAEAWTADPAAIAQDAGWTARHDLRSGLAATAAWYRERGWLRRP